MKNANWLIMHAPYHITINLTLMVLMVLNCSLLTHVLQSTPGMESTIKCTWPYSVVLFSILSVSRVLCSILKRMSGTFKMYLRQSSGCGYCPLPTFQFQMSITEITQVTSTSTYDWSERLTASLIVLIVRNKKLVSSVK